jgi:2-phospho-L-lactate guanylyltransferase
MPPTALVVVTSDERIDRFVRDQGGTVIPDDGHGLNPAVRQGIEYAAMAPGPTAVLLADIPTLRPEDLVTALSACAMHRRAMVPDAQGSGTVLLSALSTTDLHPSFGPGSADQHARECERLDLDLPALRTDVDDDKALRLAVEIGVGEHTAAVLHLAGD